MKRMVNQVYACLVVIGLWQPLYLMIGEPMVPSLLSTTERFIFLLQHDLIHHILYSFYRIFISVILSLFIGVPIGILIGWNHKSDQLISPVIYLLYPIPKIAFLPIFMVLFGINDASKIILMVTILVFQIMIATRDGVKQIDQSILHAATMMELNTFQWLWHIILPAISLNLFSALRISTGIAISALFFSENYATRYGIGYFIMNAWSMVDYKDMFSGVIALSLLSLGIYKGLDLLQLICCPWLRKK